MRRLRPSPASAIATLALFVALGGTTYAVAELPRDSVGTEQLRRSAVTEDELANRAVISRKLATGAVVPRTIARQSITGSRIAPDAIGGPQINEASLGAVPIAENARRTDIAARALTADHVDHVDTADRALGADTADLAAAAKRADRADEATHAQNADVAEALSSIEFVRETVALPEGSTLPFIVDCPGVTAGIGGGFLQTGDFGDTPLLSSSAPFGDGWIVVVADLVDDGGGTTPGEAYAVCAKADAG